MQGVHNRKPKSKFLGCLVGAAIGDGLGARREGRGMARSEDVDSLAEELEQLIYTDDTHMTIGIAESLIESKGFNGEHMAQTFIKNYKSEPWRGYGPGPPRIFSMIKAGEAWYSAANKLYQGGSLGNGSAMRVAPVALLYSNNPEKLLEIAHKSSSITHSHFLGIEGAVIQAYTVALALHLNDQETLDISLFLKILREFIIPQDNLYREKLHEVERLLYEDAPPESVIHSLGHDSTALHSVPTAIYCFLSQHDSFENALVYAVSLGGDTDNIAAMTGAISGAYHGRKNIPSRWVAEVENEEKGKDYIEQLAIALWNLILEAG